MNAVTQTVLAATAAALTLTAPSVGSADDTLGLWLFNEAEHGQNVASVSNAVNAAAYPGTYYSDGVSNPAVYSDDIPGRYLYSGLTNTVPLAELATSIRFFENDTTNDTKAGRLLLAGLSTALSSQEAYTLECFFKADLPTDAHWRTLIRGSYGNNFQWKIAANANGSDNIGLQINYDTPALFSSVGLANGWHHLALVYTGSNQLAKIYVDYCDAGASQTMTNATLSTETAIVFGSSWLTSAYEGWNGWFAAPRATARALAPSEFLCVSTMPAKTASDTSAFWPFLESGPNTEFATTFNAFDLIRYRGVAKTDSGLPLFFAPDVPAPYLYPDATAATPFCDSFQSVYFQKVDPTNTSSHSSWLAMQGAGSAMAASEACTLEFFCKQDVSKGWSAWNTAVSSGISNSSTNNQRWKIAAAWASSFMCFQRLSDSLSGYQQENAYATTGVWHHVALVYSVTNHTAKLYVDYKPSDQPNGIALTNDAAGANTPLAFGSSDINSAYEGWNGWIAAPRLTPRALGPDEFMYARKVPTVPVTVLHWRFEDGAVGASVTTATNSSAGNDYYAYTAGQGYAVSGGNKPVYSAYDNPATLLYSGDTFIGSNTRCATFTGATNAAAPWYASRLTSVDGSDAWKVATNFTAECFARMTRGAVGGNNSLLMAQGTGESNDYDWKLYCESNGTCYATFCTNQNVGSTITLASMLGDHKWHHLAVTYAGSNQTFRLYADYKLAGEKALAAPLTRNGYSLDVGRGDNTGGFNGQMDEIRFTAATLQPADFLRLKAPPGSSVTLR